MRLLRMSRLFRTLVKVLDINPALMMIMSFATKLYVSAHLIGCAWMGMHTFTAEDPDASTWWRATASPEYESYDSTFEAYVVCVYWAFTTMTTVGYGDIYAHTPTEMAYAIVIMFMGAQFFGYIVGSIAGLTEKSGGMQDVIQRRLLDFQDYLDEKIPAKLVAPNVRQPVISAITKNYAFQLEQNSPYETELGERVEVRILKEMPPRIRYESVLFIHREAIRQIGIFSQDPETYLCTSPGWFVT